MMKTIAEQGSDLRTATLRLARRLRAEKADDELSDGQYSVLALLYLHGPNTLGALADREHISPPSMNRTVNCLEESGYLVRETDEVDRRKVNISLTETGTETVRATTQKRDTWLRNQLSELSPDEREIVASAADIMKRFATS